MQKSLSIPRVVCLCLIFGASFARRAAAASKFETFNCQPAAKNGIALQNAHGFPGKDRAVECDYPSAGSCFYDPDGSLITQSASPNCPDNLVQDEPPVQDDPPQDDTTSSERDTAPSTPSQTLSTTTKSESPTTVGITESASSTGSPVERSSTESALSTTSVSSGGAGENIVANTPSNHARAPAIAGGVAAAVIVVLILVVILIWLLRRRRRRRRRGNDWSASESPPQYPVDEVHAWQEKGAVPLPTVQPQPAAPSASASDASDPDSMSSAGQESEVAQEGNAGSEESTEMLKLRLRRVEAQVEALLNLGIPETAPPGYAA